ncbi:MAG: O-antigen ligase family protein [Actinomycetota bacterium]|nr:O-antigen ligase family protein [Actinomycetota bacterium]
MAVLPGPLAKYSQPIGLALILTATMLVPAGASAAITLSVALGSTGIASLLAAWTLANTSLPLRHRVVLGLTGCAGLVLAYATLRADSPLISLYGMTGQHAGLALWIGAAAWLLASMLAGTRTSLRALIIVTAMSTGFLSALAVLQQIQGRVPLWGHTAGAFENSLSLAQLLVLGIASGIAWLVSARSKVSRLLAASALAFTTAGLLVAQSRAAFLGIAVGVLFTLLTLGARTSLSRRLLAWGTVTAAALITAAIAIASSPRVDASMLTTLNTLGTDRLTIWRSATAAFLQHPIFGRGLEQFSCWVTWGLSDGGLSYSGAYDPHSMVFALLVGGGLAGCTLALLAFGALLDAALTSYAEAGSPVLIAVLIGGVVAMGTAAMFAWISPSAFITAAILLGTVIAVGTNRTVSENRVPTRGLKLILSLSAALALALCMGSLTPLRADIDFARLTRTNSDETAALMQLSSAWPDPAFAVRASATGIGDPRRFAVVPTVTPRFNRDRFWHVDLVIQRLVLDQAVSVSSNRDTWSDFRESVEAGRQADPSSGVWDVLGTMEAQRLGKKSEARAYARRALGYRLGAQERASMVEQAGVR